MASLMAPWGWPRPVGRMYAYLLLAEAPVTLDRLAEDLGVAKSNASIAARTLEQFGNARRHTEPGTKRIFYSAPTVQTGPFASKVELLARLERLLCDRQREGVAPAVAERLLGMAGFYARMRGAIAGLIAEARDQAANDQM